MERITDIFRRNTEEQERAEKLPPLPVPKMARTYHDWTAYKPSGETFCDLYTELLGTPGGCLVSGATGSGKSVVLNGILLSILGQFRPNRNGTSKECDIYLCDPKIVEFRAYRTLPHVKRYAASAEDIMLTLDRVDAIMMERYEEMADRNIVKWDGSRIFLVIDEIGDLMLTHKKEFLPRLTHLLNLCRAAAITVFVSTQSPSRQTIPAVCALNCTAKICLKCDTAIESRQVVGIKGAELLPAHGSALVRTMTTGGIVRVEIPNCTREQVAKAIDYATAQEVACIRCEIA